MSITNGQTVLEADLDAMTNVGLSAIQQDDAQLPAGVEMHFVFPNLVAATALANRKVVFPVPFDCFVEVVAAECGDMTNPSTLQVDLSATVEIGGIGTVVDPLSLWPISRSVAIAGTGKGARILYDNTKTKGNVSFSTTAQAHRTLLKGSTLQLTVSSTSVATPSMCHIIIVLREFYARE